MPPTTSIMNCENCKGTGKSTNGDGHAITCFICNGWGNMCDACGDACEDGMCDCEQNEKEESMTAFLPGQAQGKPLMVKRAPVSPRGENHALAKH